MRLYPARFRDEWQDEMEAVLRSDHLDRESPSARRRFWLRTLAGILATAPKEHLLDLGLDVRYAMRGMRRRPLFLAVSAISMAVGIAAATVVAATLSALFLQPVAGVGTPEELINVKIFSSRSESFDSISYPDYVELRDSSNTLSDLAAFRGTVVSVRPSTGDEAVPVLAQIATANYLSVLGVTPSRGRFFSALEDRSSQPIAIVSHWFWQNRLAGRTPLGGLLVNGERLDLVGVAAPGFRGNFKGFASDLFLPLAVGNLVSMPSLDDRSSRTFELVGRLDSHQTRENAATEFEQLGLLLAQNHPEINTDLSLQVEAMTGLDADFRPGLLAFLLILLVVTGLILTIVSLNVAGMMASRAVERAHETAVRQALGAPSHRLGRQLTVETLLLGLLAAALGIAASFWGVHYVGAAFESIDSRISFDVTLDAASLTIAVVLAIAAALLASFASGSVGRKASLVQSQRGTSPKQRWRRVLVVGQVFLSFVVLTCATFFLRALDEAGNMDLGFQPDPVAVTTLNPRLIRLGADESQRFFERIVDSLNELPTVERAALVTRIPLGLGARFFPNQQTVGVPGHLPPATPNDKTGAGASTPTPDGFEIESTTVGEGAFEALGIQLAEGRSFLRSDNVTSARVAVVNEIFAERFWEPREAIGRSIVVDGEEHTVIGVAKNSKYRTLDEPPTSFLYLSFYQRQPGVAELVAKARGDNSQIGRASSLLPALREAQLALEPDLPVQDLGTVNDRLASSLLPQRVGALAAGSLGLLGLFLSSLGLAGVLAHWVNSRSREIGLRMSVGARPRQVMNLVLSQGISLTVLGVCLGVPVAFGLARALSGFLYGVSSFDPWTYLSVAGTLGITTLLAGVIPALRAVRLDPLAALRSE